MVERILAERAGKAESQESTVVAAAFNVATVIVNDPLSLRRKNEHCAMRDQFLKVSLTYVLPCCVVNVNVAREQELSQPFCLGLRYLLRHKVFLTWARDT